MSTRFGFHIISFWRFRQTRGSAVAQVYTWCIRVHINMPAKEPGKRPSRTFRPPKLKLTKKLSEYSFAELFQQLQAGYRVQKKHLMRYELKHPTELFVPLGTFHPETKLPQYGMLKTISMISNSDPEAEFGEYELSDSPPTRLGLAASTIFRQYRQRHPKHRHARPGCVRDRQLKFLTHEQARRCLQIFDELVEWDAIKQHILAETSDLDSDVYISDIEHTTASYNYLRPFRRGDGQLPSLSARDHAAIQARNEFLDTFPSTGSDSEQTDNTEAECTEPEYCDVCECFKLHEEADSSKNASQSSIARTGGIAADATIPQVPVSRKRSRRLCEDAQTWKSNKCMHNLVWKNKTAHLQEFGRFIKFRVAENPDIEDECPLMDLYKEYVQWVDDMNSEQTILSYKHFANCARARLCVKLPRNRVHVHGLRSAGVGSDSVAQPDQVTSDSDSESN